MKRIHFKQQNHLKQTTFIPSATLIKLKSLQYTAYGFFCLWSGSNFLRHKPNLLTKKNAMPRLLKDNHLLACGQSSAPESRVAV